MEDKIDQHVLMLKDAMIDGISYLIKMNKNPLLHRKFDGREHEQYFICLNEIGLIFVEKVTGINNDYHFNFIKKTFIEIAVNATFHDK